MYKYQWNVQVIFLLHVRYIYLASKDFFQSTLITFYFKSVGLIFLSVVYIEGKKHLNSEITGSCDQGNAGK